MHPEVWDPGSHRAPLGSSHTACLPLLWLRLRGVHLGGGVPTHRIPMTPWAVCSYAGGQPPEPGCAGEAAVSCPCTLRGSGRSWRGDMLNGATSQGHESGWDEMKTNVSTTLTEEDQAGGRRIRCSLLPGLSHPQGQPGGSDRLTERGSPDIPVTPKPQRQGSGWARTDSITVPPGGWPRSLQRGGAGGKRLFTHSPGTSNQVNSLLLGPRTLGYHWFPYSTPSTRTVM